MLKLYRLPIRTSTARRGAALVEFAIVASLFFLLALGLIEVARMEMAFQTITAAAQEGCRTGIVPGSTSADVSAAVNQVLSGGYVGGATVTITPTEVATLKQGQPLSVNIQVSCNAVTWLPAPLFLNGRIMKTKCTMLREGQ